MTRKKGPRREFRFCSVCDCNLGILSDDQEPFSLDQHERTDQGHQAAVERRRPIKFFLPGATDGPDAERNYEAIKRFLREEMACEITELRILNLTYKHDGKRFYAEVGKPDLFAAEVRFAPKFLPPRDSKLEENSPRRELETGPE